MKNPTVAQATLTQELTDEQINVLVTQVIGGANMKGQKLTKQEATLIGRLLSRLSYRIRQAYPHETEHDFLFGTAYSQIGHANLFVQFLEDQNAKERSE